MLGKRANVGPMLSFHVEPKFGNLADFLAPLRKPGKTLDSRAVKGFPQAKAQ